MGACTSKMGAQEVTEVVTGSPGSALSPAASPAASARSNPTLLEKKGVVPGGIGHSQFILDKSERIQDVYSLEKKKLGQGSYGSVCRATHKSTGAVRAIKTIAKGKMRNVERFKKEIAIMKIMDHPSIIKLYETFEDQRNIYLAMELCQGGELFDRIIAVGHFTETQAAIVMKQILAAIFYMHEQHICHRDLKPENFLFQTKDAIEENVLKIIDFGLSCNFKDGETMSTRAGTPYYVAPQVLAGKYDKSCDLWSAGVIMYILLCGKPPFYGQNDQEILAKVKLGNVSFGKDWKGVSADAKELVQMLIKKDTKERYTAEQALMHQWIKHKAPKAADVPLDANFVEKLRHFRSQNKFMKAALHVIAQQLNESQIKGLRDTFLCLDKNSDGMVSLTEMKEGLSKAGLTVLPADMQEIMSGIDADGSGVIDYTEFLAATLERRQYLQENICWCAFRVFDLNGDGKVSKEELKTMLRSGSAEDVMDADVCADILREVDKNGDGVVDFQEFVGMLRGSQAGGA